VADRVKEATAETIAAANESTSSGSGVHAG
jgi:hypothetical protein